MIRSCYFLYSYISDLYFFVETVPKYKDGCYNRFARTIFWLLRGSNLARVLTDLNETCAVKGLFHTSDRTQSRPQSPSLLRMTEGLGSRMRQNGKFTPTNSLYSPQESLLAGYVARANVNNEHNDSYDKKKNLIFFMSFICPCCYVVWTRPNWLHVFKIAVAI